MKHGNTSATLISTLILAAALTQAGCATSGNQRSENTRTTMKAVEKDYVQALAQVDATGTSLETLLNPNIPNKKKPFERYSSNASKMSDIGKKLFEHSDKMQSQQKNYFEEWRMQGNTYTNPQIQALSDQRRADLSAVFARISEANVGVKGAFKSYMSDIVQLRTYFSTDLTPKGVESITPVAEKAVQDGDNLKQALNPVLSAIKEAREELAQGDGK